MTREGREPLLVVVFVLQPWWTLTSTNSPFPVSTNTTTTAETERGLERGRKEGEKREFVKGNVPQQRLCRCMTLWIHKETVEESHGYNTDAEVGSGLKSHEAKTHSGRSWMSDPRFSTEKLSCRRVIGSAPAIVERRACPKKRKKDLRRRYEERLSVVRMRYEKWSPEFQLLVG